MKIYLIVGITGEYDSEVTWPVIAYLDKNKAADHTIKAQIRADEILMKVTNGKGRYNPFSTRDLEKNEFDLYFRMDYTGTDYHIEEVDLEY